MIKINKLASFSPPGNWERIRTVDLHTGGEPLRVFIDGLPEIKGDTILEKRKYFRENHDHLRKMAMFEPRGHADMYGAIITEPVTEGADFGTFFLHNEGYSTMCGHAIIALTKLVLDSGMIKKEGSSPLLEIDTPPGRIRAQAFRESGTVKSVSFLNVPSFLLIADENVEVPGIGRVSFDIAYGGAFYVFCDAQKMGLNLDSSDYNRLIDYGRKIKNSVIENFKIDHPFEQELSFLYGTIFLGPPHDPNNWSRNVCVFAEGEVDRSPTGSGVSARAGLHYAKGEMEIGKPVIIESILGSVMHVEVVETVEYGPYMAVIPRVTGTAHFTGRNEFWVDPSDPLKDGFIFR